MEKPRTTQRRHAGAPGTRLICIETAQEDSFHSVTPRLQPGIDGRAVPTNPIPCRTQLLDESPCPRGRLSVSNQSADVGESGRHYQCAIRNRELTTDGRSAGNLSKHLRQQPLSWPKCVGSGPLSLGIHQFGRESNCPRTVESLPNCLQYNLQECASVRGSKTDVSGR